MELIYTENPSEFVSDIKFTVAENRINVTFKWPLGIEQVFIFKTKTSEEFNIETAKKENARIYTLDEYKIFLGYSEEITEVNEYRYSIFPFLRKDGFDEVIVQNNSENTAVVQAGKIEVRYSVKQKTKLFKSDKIVSITVSPDKPLGKELLCYVKKSNGYPSHNKDGIVYNFVDDFFAGDNVLPDLVVNKNEYVNLFLTDFEKHKNIYVLKHV